MRIVTHTDLDGICCAALFIRKFGSSIDILYLTVQQAKDFSSENLKIDYTCDLPKINDSINIDHHATNYNNLKATNRLSENDIVDPNAYSATELVFNYLEFYDDPIAEQIRNLGHLADRAMLPREYKHLDTVLNMNSDNDSFLRDLSNLLAKVGKEILQTQWLKKHYERVSSTFEETQQTISEFLDRNQSFPRIVIVDTRNKIPGKLAKEVIKPLFDRNVAVLALIYKKSMNEPIRVSFRVTKSDQDHYDVSKVARFFGGGGHRMAAACTPNQELIPNSLIDQLKKIRKSNDSIGYFPL